MLIIAAFALSIAASTSAADYFKLENVKRVDQDLYSSGNLYVQTQYCYHYTYGEEAVLKWQGAYGDNKIIWADDSTCAVKDIFRK
jgi:hypothetical protein